VGGKGKVIKKTNRIKRGTEIIKIELGIKKVRVEEMLEKPGSQNVDGTLGEASLGSPGFLFHHAHLVEGSLLSQALLEKLQPWGLSLGQTR